EELRDQRERQKPVRNRRAERPGLGPLGVHMDPLVVARGLGKQVDLLLRDGDPVGHGDLLAYAGTDFGVGAEDFHRPNVAPPPQACCLARDTGPPPRPLRSLRARPKPEPPWMELCQVGGCFPSGGWLAAPPGGTSIQPRSNTLPLLLIQPHPPSCTRAHSAAL